MSIELSLEDVKSIALNYGFQIEVVTVSWPIYILFPFVCVNERNCIWFIYGLQKEKTIETTYSTNPKSMMQVSFFSNLLSVSQHFLQPYWFQYVNSLVIFAEPLLCCFLDYEKEISNSEGGFA